MSDLKNDADKEVAALKWLALAVLHGVNNNAEEISISLSDDGKISVTAEYRKTELPSPDPETARQIFEAVGRITHIEGDKGKTALALGIRDSSIDLGVKIKNKEGKKKISRITSYNVCYTKLLRHSPRRPDSWRPPPQNEPKGL